MTDPTTPETTLESFSDLPMQPSGSGVADLEIAYEQMRLAEEAGDGDSSVNTDAGDGIATGDAATAPTTDTDAAADSAAHPS